MIRRVFAICALVSWVVCLALCVVRVALWHGARDEGTVYRIVLSRLSNQNRIDSYLDVNASHGTVLFSWRNNAAPPWDWGKLGPIPSRSLELPGLRVTLGLPWYMRIETSLICPIALTAVLPTIWVIQWLRRRRRERLKAHFCLSCGYDLRGSPGPACPECGAAMPVKHRPAAPRCFPERSQRFL